MYKKRNNNRSKQNKEVTHNKIIRCKLLMRPVLELETCDKYDGRNSQVLNHVCMNCKHSF